MPALDGQLANLPRLLMAARWEASDNDLADG